MFNAVAAATTTGDCGGPSIAIDALVVFVGTIDVIAVIVGIIDTFDAVAAARAGDCDGPSIVACCCCSCFCLFGLDVVNSY